MAPPAFSLVLTLLLMTGYSCLQIDNRHETIPVRHSEKATFSDSNELFKNSSRIVHVYVALCDNKNQRIVPVPEAIGNGQDPANNLYWGCAGGIKGYFNKSRSWKLILTQKGPAPHILERCVFKHNNQDAYLVADAYDGAFIHLCISDFFEATAGGRGEVILAQKEPLGIGGLSHLIAYIGHDGLMDFTPDHYPIKKNDQLRETIILSCISKKYFSNGIKRAGATPLLWSTGLMSPEAYTLEAALTGWLQNEKPEQIRQRAAKAYDRYQHCGVKAASRLLVTGWD